MERFLKRFRDKIRARAYVITVHAEEEMTEDGFAVYDVERGILRQGVSWSGKEIRPVMNFDVSRPREDHHGRSHRATSQTQSDKKARDYYGLCSHKE